MRELGTVNEMGVTPNWGYATEKRLTGKVIHVIGPRRLENDLLVSFIGKETGADCFVTNFDNMEILMGNSARKPGQLLLIDYREPRLHEILKLAYANGCRSLLERRLISLFKAEKNKGTADPICPENACGILYKCDSAMDLLDWIYRLFNVADPEKSVATHSMEVTSEIRSSRPLTWRELQLLMLMTDGLRNHEIADRIGISRHTVRTHLYNIFAKIGARNRLEAMSWIEFHIRFLFFLS